MLNCRDVAQSLDLLLDPGETALDLRPLERHLEECKACRSLLSNLQSTRKVLQHCAPPAAAADDAMLKRIESAVRERIADNAKGTGHTRLRLVQGSGGRDEEGGSEEVEAIFNEIRTAMGSVSNMFRAYARHPAILSSTWERVKSVMLQGSLYPTLKEAIAVVISHDNACNYCVDHHSRNLLSLGMDQEEIRRLLADPMAGNFTPKERALLVLARQANSDPHGASVETLNLARRAGADDLEIIEALAVMELFTSLNRFLNTLDIPLEEAAG